MHSKWILQKRLEEKIRSYAECCIEDSGELTNNALSAAFLYFDLKEATKLMSANKYVAIKRLKYIHRTSKNIKTRRRLKKFFRRRLKGLINNLQYSSLEGREIVRSANSVRKILYKILTTIK